MSPAMETVEKTQATKTYKHFSFSSVKTPSFPEKKRLEFFYVGSSSENIDLLIRSFQSGYAAENPEKAAFILTRLVNQSQSIPDVLIVEGSLGMKKVHDFYQLISSQKQLSKTPLVVEGSGLDGNALDSFRHIPYVDEIVFLGQNTRERLSSKIGFLRKVKERSQAVPAAVESTPALLCDGRCVAKRVFDAVVSTILLILLSPVFLLIALAIKLESKGPIFYVAKRAGKGYRIFDFYKFRTMYAGSDERMKEYIHLNQYSGHIPQEASAVFVKFNNDPRVTRVGAFLRKLSLDELPQLYNVLKGDMSLVGNRPLPLYEAAALTTDKWAKRFMAPAGMTGLWQIKKNRHDDMSAEERILLDCNYAEKSTFIYDLWIMAHTPSALIQKTNA